MLEEFADERGLPYDYLAKHIRVAESHEPYPGWYAFDYPNYTGTWHTRYRNPRPTGPQDRWRSSKGASTHLYNPTLAGPHTPEIWLCEGEMDTLTLVHLGLHAVGVPGVKAFRKEWKPLFEEGFVIVAFDNDEAGNEAAAKAARAFHPSSAVFQPPTGLDLNDWWVKDPDTMVDVIEEFRTELGMV
jgi:hypothetical protein